ncbi:hypothetical protein BJX64DRAFT_14718 [Aspergillus heterothallicus]
MPAIAEPGSEGRRPPSRRSSITQQFQRMFNIEKTDSRKSVSYDDTSKANSMASALPSDHSIRTPVGNNDSHDYAAYRQSGISSNEHSHMPSSSLGSKIAGANASDSRHSSVQTFGLETQQTGRNAPDDPVHRQDAMSHIVQKKDRRATKRLEAERLELEKRLFKLEEAERTGDVSALRRESRRLTKKQPLGSSSRSSSVSADESRSRPSSRLSSFFASSRRRSRSRSSSVDDTTAGIEDPSGDNPNSLPKLSSSLPERLSIAISKELAARKDALLMPPEQSTPTLRCADTLIQHDASEQLMTQAHEAVVPGAMESSSNYLASKGEHVHEAALDKAKQQDDLDRALFTASLNSGKRRVSSEHALKPANPVKPSAVAKGISLIDFHTAADIDQIETHSKRNSKTRAGLPVSMLTRATTDGVVPRYQKTYKSSPLHESQTVNGDEIPSSPKKTTIVATRTGPLNVLRTSSGNVLEKIPAPLLPKSTNKLSATESRIPRSSFSKKKPASKQSQLAPLALLTKPRFYNSLNKVTGPPGGRPNVSMALSSIPQQRDTSPSVPQKSPKRNSRSISQSRESLRPADSILDGRSLSAGRSYDSESDYNTADEAASIISKLSDDNNAAAFSNMRVVPKKGVSSGFDSASTTIVSPNLKTNSKKQVKKTKPAGRDQLVAKLFVICCRCKFWHDIPSEVYASLTNSDPLSAALDQELAAWERNSLSDRLTTPATGTRSLREASTKPVKADFQQSSLRTRITADLPSGPVKCCWCEHHMSKQCCQGWTTVVQMRQRHH